uniref:Uncharacterized protein n=1 Tax=Theileria parva TaxID=5875 RepID=Q4MYN5_THEPA|eukprot:XP_762930.1 hypothetical protein [Theileria parva strain Muguga]
MYIRDFIDLWIYLSISLIICKSEDKFGIEIPNIHSLQEAFETFEHVPKPENITELGTDLLRTAAVSNFIHTISLHI